MQPGGMVKVYKKTHWPGMNHVAIT